MIAVKRGTRANFSVFQQKWNKIDDLSANFRERRFRLLFRSLRFDDVTACEQRSTTDKLFSIRDFQSLFVTNFQKAHNLSDSVTVDEMLVALCGRCNFMSYMAQ